MKAPSILKLLPHSLLASCFLVAAITITCAEPTVDDPFASAQPAAKAWLSLIDAGNYEASYDAGGDGLHQAVTQKKWDLVLKALRPVYGDLVSRTVSKHLYQPNGIQGLSGECMVIAYDTSFKKLPVAMEMVILRFEDGKWRGIGYTAGPKPTTPGTPDQFLSTPNSQTSTEVIPHDKAQPAKSH